MRCNELFPFARSATIIFTEVWATATKNTAYSRKLVSVKMMTFPKILKAFLIFVEIQRVSSFATTFQECESPCVNGQTCELSCSAVSGTIVTGLIFFSNSNPLVGCNNQQCSATFPAFHNYTQINSTTASLQILNFNDSFNGGLYECADGNGAKNSTQVREVMIADIPDGNLTGSNDTTGHVTCTIAHVGTATLILRDQNDNVLNTSTSTVVTADILRNVSYVTCSLQWSTCPKYIKRKISSIIIRTNASTTEHPTTGCVCPCPCKCEVVIALVTVLAIMTAALCAWTFYLCCKRGGICRQCCQWRNLATLEIVITIVLIIVTCVFIIAVGAYSVNCEKTCNCEGCLGNPCCHDTDCPDAYKASIAFLVLGCIAVFFAIVVLLLGMCCGSGETLESTTVNNVARNEKPSEIYPLGQVAVSGGNNRTQVVTRSSGNNGPQYPNPFTGPQRYMLRTFVLVNFIKAGKTHLVRREWLSLEVIDSSIEMFCAKWPPENQNDLAQTGAALPKGWTPFRVGITSSTDDFKRAKKQVKLSDKEHTQVPPGTDIEFQTRGADLNSGVILKEFVLVEFIRDRKTRVVHQNWLQLREENSGLESFYAALPPNNREELAKGGAKPSAEWEHGPVMILASTDDFQRVMKQLKDIQEAQGRDRNKGGTNGESLDEKLPSPKGPLPPLKNEKDRPDPKEPRPLPIPHQTTLQTQRRPSLDAHVNMSGSNSSPLPMRNNFTPGQQASGQSESAMTPVGSSSMKRT